MFSPKNSNQIAQLFLINGSTFVTIKLSKVRGDQILLRESHSKVRSVFKSICSTEEINSICADSHQQSLPESCFVVFNFFLEKRIKTKVAHRMGVDMNITSIQELTENTEFDNLCLFSRHVQMTHFEVCTLVCPLNVWPGQGFYVELFFDCCISL